MSLWGAAQDDYYPQDGNTGASFYGATTAVNDWVFGDGAGSPDGNTFAIIRSIIVPNTTVSSAPFPVLELKDGDGNTMMSWTLTDQVADGNLLGPDGIKAPNGFYLTVSAADGAYAVVVYDKS